MLLEEKRLQISKDTLFLISLIFQSNLGLKNSEVIKIDLCHLEVSGKRQKVSLMI
jgi:hypothetical protein